MELHSFSVGPFAENTYLLTENDKALLVDPGFYENYEFEAFRKELGKNSSSLIAIVLTHAHVDHMLGLNRVLNIFDVPVYVSDKDRYLWNNFSSQAQMFGLNSDPVNVIPKTIPITKNWELDPFTFEVRYTPGHAPDHIILYSVKDDLVIAGDTLFREGIGRTDLYKGNFNTLECSIREELYTLPDKTTVYPGHGPKTSIEHEKRHNPFVKIS